jgi:hypothetical protein
MQAASIKLGGEPYQIQPLTIAQLEIILPLVRSIDLMTPEGMKAATTLIGTAMTRGTPAISPDRLREIPGVTIQELADAINAVILLTGLEVPKKPEAVSTLEIAEAA